MQRATPRCACAGWDVGILGDQEQGIPPMKVTSKSHAEPADAFSYGYGSLLALGSRWLYWRVGFEGLL